MKLSGPVFVASLTFIGAATAWSADATRPIDPTERNPSFAPAPSVTPEKKTPETKTSVQEKRVDKNVVDKKPAAVGDRRAAIDVEETREKNVREKDSHRPQKLEQPVSAYNQRESAMTPGANVTRLPMMAKYQDGLTASNVTASTRISATDRATAAKINRFIFRKNAPETSIALEGATITPAAGPAAVQKK
jgi:hypothetical protein